MSVTSFAVPGKVISLRTTLVLCGKEKGKRAMGGIALFIDGRVVSTQVIERNRQENKFSEVITDFEAGKKNIRLVGTYGEQAVFDDLLYAIACQKIVERLGEKNDNIALRGGYGII